MRIFSSMSILGSYATVAVLGVSSLFSFSYMAHAAELKPCYQQFNEDKKAGNIKEKTFKEYKASHCDKVTKEEEKPIANKPKNDEKQAVEHAKESGKEMVKKETTEKAPVTTGNVVFPEKVDAKFVNEKEGKARMMTCQEQYKANKVSGKNGGLKWIQKGGGYYSECNKHLKALAK